MNRGFQRLVIKAEITKYDYLKRFLMKILPIEPKVDFS